MTPSLSIILPVHNAESTLAARVERLLESLTDLTPQFEVLIIDDGSTDLTEDVACELSREFPQIRLTRHSHQLGNSAAIQTGLTMAAGELVLVSEPSGDASTTAMRQLWQLRSESDLVMARPALQHAGWMRRDKPDIGSADPSPEPSADDESQSNLTWHVLARRRRDVRRRRNRTLNI